MYQTRSTIQKYAGLIAIAVLTVGLAVVATLTWTETPAAADTTVLPVLNEDAPDPDIISVGSAQYVYTTNVPGYFTMVNVPVWENKNDAGWLWKGDALPTLPSWANPGLTWAPDVFEIAPNDFRLYFTARHAASGRQCIGVASSASPIGPFVATNHPIVCEVTQGGSIDASSFTDPITGKNYLLWKTDANAIGQASTLRSRQLSSDGMYLVGVQSNLLNYSGGWEHPLIEQPEMVFSNGFYTLLYSGNWWESTNYAVGWARCSGPLGPCTKKSSSGPTLTTQPGAKGPGAVSVTRDSTGKLIAAYHAWPTSTSYAAGGYRATFVTPIAFSVSGPVFGTTAKDPIGSVDTLTKSNNTVTARGWALDYNTPDPINVAMTVNGTTKLVTEASIERPDVASVHEMGDKHGFVFSTVLGPGTHSVCVKALNKLAGQDRVLRCQTISTEGPGPAAPLGGHKTIKFSPREDKLKVRGWALNENNLSERVMVQIFDNGKLVKSVRANKTNISLPSAFGGKGAPYGWSTKIPLTPGTHKICPKVKTADGSLKSLRCRTVVSNQAATETAPVSKWAKMVDLEGDRVRVKGWSIDPNSYARVSLKVVIDGKLHSTIRAGKLSTSLPTTYKLGTRHGFNNVISYPAGAKRICLDALDISSIYTPPVRLGCKDLP